MNPIPPPPPLPKPLKRAAVVCLILSALVGYSALNEAMSLDQLDVLKERLAAQKLPVAPEMKDLTVAAVEAQLAGLKSMKGSRRLILGGLWVASILAVVGAARLLRSSPQPREGLLRLVARGCLAVAVLRTLEGAQMTALAKRMGSAAEKFSHTHPGLAEAPEGSLTLAFVMASVFLTVAVAGAFLGLSMYFRSDKAQQMVAIPQAGTD